MKSTAMVVEEVEPAAIEAWAEGRMIYARLTDGRVIGFPADRFRRGKRCAIEGR